MLFRGKLKLGIISRFKSTDRQDSRIIFVGAPLHGNLGDHAIALAMRSFFEKEFSGRCVIEIPGTIFSRYADVFQRFVLPSDCGGGYRRRFFWAPFGLTKRRWFVRLSGYSRKNRIVIFPQTVFFDNSQEGLRELETTRKLYRSHPDLHLWIRDNSISIRPKKTLWWIFHGCSECSGHGVFFKSFPFRVQTFRGAFLLSIR